MAPDRGAARRWAGRAWVGVIVLASLAAPACRDRAPSPAPMPPAVADARRSTARAATSPADAAPIATPVPTVPAGADPALAAALLDLPAVTGVVVSAPARLERSGQQLATTWCVPAASPAAAAEALAAALRQAGYDDVGVRGAAPVWMVVGGKDGVRLAGRVGDSPGPGCGADRRGWPARLALFTERALTDPVVPDLDLDDPPDGL